MFPMYNYQLFLIKCSVVTFSFLMVCNCFAQLNTGPIVNDKEASANEPTTSLFEECFLTGLNTANNFDVKIFETEFYSGLDQLSLKHNFNSLKSINKINEFLAKYLTKGVEDAIPQDALLGGRFNSISAVMLQSLALQHLNINYILQDTKTGMRANVIFNTDTLLLSEDVAKATDNVSLRHFNPFKNTLFRNGSITKTNANDNTFIDENFVIDTVIQINQLPALQYFNDGVQLFKAEAYSPALKQLEKAYQLYQVPYIEQWMKLVLGVALSDEKANDDPTAECDFLLKFSDVNWDVDNIQQQVMNVATTQAQQLANEPQKIERFLTCIENGIDNEDLKNTVSEKIYLVLAESYYSKAQYREAVHNFKRLYQRDSTVHHNYIKNSVIQSLYSINEDSVRIDSLISYEQSFSFLKDDVELINYKLYLLTTYIYDNFESENKVEGLAGLDKLRNSFSINDDKKLNTQQIGSAYAAAVQYFINIQDFETAKTLLSEGTDYCGDLEPFNQLLITIKNNK